MDVETGFSVHVSNTSVFAGLLPGACRMHKRINTFAVGKYRCTAITIRKQNQTFELKIPTPGRTYWLGLDIGNSGYMPPHEKVRMFVTATIPMLFVGL